ncbi:MAG: porin, partial [Moraxellaceae bacterium]
MMTFSKRVGGGLRSLCKSGVTVGIASLAVAVPGLAQADGIQLNEKLSVKGFIDMSYTHTDTDSTDPTKDGIESSMGLDQFEMNFLYSFDDKLSAVVDLEYQDNGGDDGEEVDIEQAYFTYGVMDGVSVKAGRFLSYSGWETEDPTGLMQYSGTGYGKYFYGAYQQGVSALYTADMFDAAVSLVNGLGDLEGEDRGENSKRGVELMFAVRPIENLTVKAFYMTDHNDDVDETTTLINVWASYAISGFTFALEGNSSTNAGAAVGTAVDAGEAGKDVEATGYLAMVNYAMDNG